MSQRYQGGVLGVGFNPLQAPNAPTIGTAAAGGEQVSVVFTAPANVGGSAISSYRVLANPGGIGATTSSSPVTISGLTNGTTYTFSVAAVNSYGFSPYSGTATATPKLFVEDVFSTYLYTGTGAAQTITNGIDLAGKGGMVWLKGRSTDAGHFLFDTSRGAGWSLSTENGLAQANYIGYQNFTSTGFSINAAVSYNLSSQTYASWTFREAPKFFDVVTYTGTGSARTIAHNLGVAPGCVIVKAYSRNNDPWTVYHRGQTSASYFTKLNTTDAQALDSTVWNGTAPTSSEFSIGTSSNTNASGITYVAYLYAHDATSDGLIQCGSYTGTGVNPGPTVTLGWEPQWLMIKRASGGTGDWYMFDNMRGLTVQDGTSGDAALRANSVGAEFDDQHANPTSTGFQVRGTDPSSNTSGSTYVYIAIRRGPMKTPTLGTSVFTPILRTGTGSSATITTSFAPDFVLTKATTGTYATYWWNAVDRLRGALQGIFTNATTAETAVANGLTTLSSRSFSVGTDFNYNDSGTTYINYTFGRAPNFFDEVCYTGTGVLGRTVAHNLGVAPEMIIVKRRNATSDWGVYHSALGNTKLIYLNYNLTPYTAINWWNNTTPTASVFTVGDQNENNSNGSTYVAYLFASCPGVSKVGSYTGTGALQTINCAFTTGARFVLIKRTDSTGDWFVWDSARGISSGSDPYSVLNDPAGQVTGTNYVDTTATGFQVTAAAPAGINANGGTYIFLAIS